MRYRFKEQSLKTYTTKEFIVLILQERGACLVKNAPLHDKLEEAIKYMEEEK